LLANERRSNVRCALLPAAEAVLASARGAAEERQAPASGAKTRD
jgi:hypothetical protein